MGVEMDVRQFSPPTFSSTLSLGEPRPRFFDMRAPIACNACFPLYKMDHVPLTRLQIFLPQLQMTDSKITGAQRLA